MHEKNDLLSYRGAMYSKTGVVHGALEEFSKAFPGMKESDYSSHFAVVDDKESFDRRITAGELEGK